MVSSIYNRKDVRVKSQVLWSSDQDLHKINPVSIPAWVGDWLTNPH